MIEILAQIESRQPRFNAGIVLWDDIVVEAAPIVGHMKRGRWTREQVRKHAAKRGWKIKVIHEIERTRP